MPRPAPPREKLVTLGDATLHTDDLALLVPPAWFNDALISFWGEHLRLNVSPPGEPQPVAVLLPNVAFFLSLCHDEAEGQVLLRELRLRERAVLIAPVNDSDDLDFTRSAQGPSGTHWSLLAFEREAQTFYYLDSLPGAPNASAARRLAAKLRHLLAIPDAAFVRLQTHRQENMYDCGAYVCMFAEDIVLNYREGKPLRDLYKDRGTFSPEDVEAKRQEIGKLACRLLDKQQRSGQGSSKS